MQHSTGRQRSDIGGSSMPMLGGAGAVGRNCFESKEELKLSHLPCHLSWSRTQKTDGVGFLHRVSATDGVNFYEIVPQCLELLPKSSYMFPDES